MSVKVKVVQLGKGVKVCELSPGTNVGEALESQDIPVGGMEVRVNAEVSGFDQSLADGDVITVVPMIKGGIQALLLRTPGSESYN